MYQRPLWWTDAHGWLGFVPLSPDYQNVPFDCLSSIPYRCPDESAAYALDSYDSYEWQRLEHFLYWATSLMMNRIRAPAVRPYAPSAYNYNITFKNQRIASRQTSHARDWFSLWGALFSYLACIGNEQAFHTANFTYTRVPSWCDFLPASGLDPELVRAIQFHQICQVSQDVQRAGVFLSLLNPEPNQPSVEWFVEHHIPVWYLWTQRERDAALRDHKLARYAPPMPPVSPIITSPSSPPSPYEEPSTTPWILFFESRKPYRERRLRMETPAEKQQRLEREGTPPTSNVPVFEWRPNPLDSRFERFPVNPSERDITLLHYDSEHKSYDPMYNEWDCWPYEDSDDDLEIQSNDAYLDSTPYNIPITSPPTPPCAPATKTEVILPPYETLEILSTFYGFQPVTASTRDIPWPRKAFYRLMGLHAPQGEDFYESEHIVASYEFLMDVIHQRVPVSDVCDLVRGSTNALSGKIRPYRLVGGLYILDFGSQTTRPWKLAVTRASDLLVVFRQDASLTDYEMACKLVGLGIKIKTLQPQLYFPRPPLPSKTFPILLQGHEFTSGDYNIYVRQRTAFLRSPRGRAALLSGGYLWRFAVEAVSVQQALLGPSEERVPVHTTSKQAIRVPSNPGFVYYDDQLTEYETLLLCGTYVCYTGKFPLNLPIYMYDRDIGQGQQIKLMSWWPPVSLFEKPNGINFHRWTPQNEEEYQWRLLRIQSGIEKPRSVRKWRDLITGNSRTRDLNAGVEALASSFLAKCGRGGL
ncbi:hypothetical protein BDN72DRAFT_902896 [Pluteus cervinus]|uniref:Uncharacterized protein n=1 Tax=Pluteus cervinus TaxID=181527 RepID=A0ACD3AAD3_9AGAR|nr:hypothetical protein BDN72DRAFT_902896 [Pluteus cervinus]